MKLKRFLFSRIAVMTYATVVLLLGVLHESALLKGPELKIYDRLIRETSSVEPSSVVVVGINEKSVAAIGEWPLSRSIIARAVEEISAAGAVAIGLDVLYAEKALNPGLEEVIALKAALAGELDMGDSPASRQLAQWIDEAITRLDHDAELISAVKSARNIVLPFQFYTGTNGTAPAEVDARLSGLMRINSVKGGEPPESGIDSFPVMVKRYLYSGTLGERPYVGIRETYRELAGKAGGLGHAHLMTDHDGVIRTLPLLIPFQGRYFPSFALQLYAKFRGVRIRHLSLNASEMGGGVVLGGHTVALDENFMLRIRYRQPSDLIHRVSMADLLDNRIETAVFRDKIVLIGAVPGLDAGVFRTPLDENMNPVEILAHAVDTLVENNLLFRPFWVRFLEMAVLIYFGIILIFVIPKLSLKLGGFILGIFLVTWIGAVILLFGSMGIWLWLLPPLYLSAGGFLFTGIWMRMTALRNEAIELNRSLGATYQSQGLLDMAFEKYKKCPVEDREVKQQLYELGLEYERKRMVNKASAVYAHLRKAGRYGDLDRRLQSLRSAGTMMISNGSESPVGTLSLDDSAVLPTFGRYEIVRELGQGAMGTVYLGRDPKIKREVAIKTLAYNAVDPAEIETVKSRFFHEAETAGRLSHPNIVTIYDIGEEHDMAYMAMELLDGDDLSTYCRKGALLPLNTVLDIMLKVARALDYAHQNGVVHRDIKPANIMRLKTGQVKVTDFGIARITDQSKTRTGIVLGTPSYMSPEQVAGRKVDGRSDLFSLGVVFYELLSGEKPFTGENLTAVMYAITKGKHKPLVQLIPDLTSDCGEIVDKLMMKTLSRRYQSAEIVVQDIEKCMARLGISGE